MRRPSWPNGKRRPRTRTALAAELSTSLKAVDRERRNALNSLSDAYKVRGLNFLNQGDSGRGLLWLSLALEYAAPDDRRRQDALRLLLGAWNLRRHHLQAIIPASESLSAPAFSPDGKTVLTGSDDKTARLWNAGDGTPVGPPLQHQDSGQGRGVQPRRQGRPDRRRGQDGAALERRRRQTHRLAAPASGHGQGRGVQPRRQGRPDREQGKTARLWNAADGKPIGPPLQHQDEVRAVAFSPDGKTVLTGSHDKTAWLWNAADGKPIGPPLQHLGPGLMPWRSAPTARPCSPAASKIARLWNAADGTPIGSPIQRQRHR